jgi:preprotein translocase subunit SecD
MERHHPIATESLYTLLERAPSTGGRPTAAYLFSATGKKLLAGPAVGPAGRAQLITSLLARYHGKQPPHSRILTVPPQATVLTCSATTSIVCPGLSSLPAPGASYYYLVKQRPGTERVPAMTGSDLERRRTHQAFDRTNGAPIVTIQFTTHGDSVFHRITRAEALRGQALGAPQHFAIVLDDQIRSWPQIDYHAYPDGIDPAGSGAEIVGLASLREARDLATILATEPLPVAFSVVG